jgi:hypothetical protein
MQERMDWITEKELELKEEEVRLEEMQRQLEEQMRKLEENIAKGVFLQLFRFKILNFVTM